MQKSYMTIVATSVALITGCTPGSRDHGVGGTPLGPSTAPAVLELPTEASSTDASELELNAFGGVETQAVKSVGCAGVESARWGGKYSCKGALYVTARNTCNRKIAIEICIEKWVGGGRRKMDCGLSSVGAGRTLQYWTCDATGRYTIRAREPW